MQLTEPQAGSDVGALRTKAERAGDGTYRITGQKIFITYGEHDLTDNIIHFVLARLPDAPPGTKGISLFLVPKFLVNADGSLGERNDVRAHSIEHKIGIHASPTCTMVYGDNGGAIGYLVGEENRGMACMFTMMNHARLAVGLQGVGIAERATQQAHRLCARAQAGPRAGATDRRRSSASRRQAHAADHARAHQRRARDLLRHRRRDRSLPSRQDEAARKAAHERASLLTPIAKAFSTDIGIEVASLGVQVHGGMGFIEETGAAQHLRDARIAADLRGHQRHPGDRSGGPQDCRSSGGNAVRGYIAELRDIVDGGQRHQRSGVRLYRQRASQKRSTALNALPNGCLPSSATIRTQRLPARRLI